MAHVRAAQNDGVGGWQMNRTSCSAAEDAAYRLQICRPARIVAGSLDEDTAQSAHRRTTLLSHISGKTTRRTSERYLSAAATSRRMGGAWPRIASCLFLGASS